jgi:hypothetical protein
MVCDFFHASVTSYVLLLILLSTYPLQDARRMNDAFKLAAGVAGMAIAKGLIGNGIGIRASSNSLTRFFSLAFSASMPPMES